MNEVKMNERFENDCDMKTVIARSRGLRTDKSWCKRLRRKGFFKEKSFEFRVKLQNVRRVQKAKPVSNYLFNSSSVGIYLTLNFECFSDCFDVI